MTNIHRLSAVVMYRGIWWKLHWHVDRWAYLNRESRVLRRVGDVLVRVTHRWWVAAADRWYVKEKAGRA